MRTEIFKFSVDIESVHSYVACNTAASPLSALQMTRIKGSFLFAPMLVEGVG